jgi:hypothetical protein
MKGRSGLNGFADERLGPPAMEINSPPNLKFVPVINRLRDDLGEVLKAEPGGFTRRRSMI